MKMTTELLCAVCGHEITSKLDFVKAKDDSDAVCCRTCYDAIIERLRHVVEPPACPGCGAPYGSGCDCRENRRAITRGERVKALREEP
jgi:uncharacterized protein (DUF1786 family)